MKSNNKAREFLSLLNRLIRRQIMLRAVPMVVKFVNKGNATIVAEQEDSPETFDIRLRASIDDNILGVVVYPKVGSTVLVDYIINDRTNAYVTKMSEIDGALITIGSAFKCDLKPNGDLVLNDGNNGAMVKIQALEAKINTINANFQALVAAAQAGQLATVGAAPADGAAGFAAFVTGLDTVQTINSSGLNNDKIKH
jgi:hypothetical protein